MKRFTAHITHTYDTILRMCRAMDDTFFFRRKISMVIIGVMLTVFGVWNMDNVVGILFLMIGCWLLASLNLPAKNQADNVRKALAGKYPANKYEFFDKHFVLYAQNQDIINYSNLIRLVEDEMYCYLWISRSASYMIEKYSLGKEIENFKAFMEKQTGKEWEKPQKLMGVNLGTIIRMFKGEGATKKAKKK